MNLLLASASPRRRQLLTDLGILFEVYPSDCAEEGVSHLPPEEQACVLARDKALSVSARVENGIVLGADTIVVLDHEVLGKPKTPDHAKEILTRLSGRSHKVITGVALSRIKDGIVEEVVSDYEETQVFFRNLTAENIELYVATGDCLDKAGAYGIQGLAALLVERIEGDYFNVVGLPLGLLDQLLHRWGISLIKEGTKGKRPMTSS